MIRHDRKKFNATQRRRASAVVIAALVLFTVSCSKKKPAARSRATGPQATSARDTADMLQADFSRLNNLPNTFSTKIDPPAILLDARYSSDGKDVQVVISRAPGIENGPWNVLEVVSRNANLRSLGVRPGDTIKCYLFPDSETRHRQRVTGEVDPQMVTHEATDLVVAQVLDDNRLLVVGGVVPPRDLEVRIPEADFAEFAGFSQAAMDQMRDEGKVDAFGVKLPATMIALDQLANMVGSMNWPPRIEVWRVQDNRMKAIGRALGGYAKRGEPALGWEPSPDAEEVGRLVESFNRWLRSRNEIARVEPPTLLQTLPESLREDARLRDFLSEEAINRSTFADHEGQLLQESVWCRDVASWSAGEAFDPLPRARKLFDWTVRNVTLTDSPRVANNRPWHTLVFGQGSAAQRAWVFCQLCRQQRIPCCVIQVPPAEGPEQDWLWCGVVDHKQLYLFDPQLGLEIPSGDGVATLDAVMQDDSILRGLDLPDAKYPVTADQAMQAKACVVADSLALSSRAAELEKQQGGESSLALHQDVDTLAKQLEAVPGVTSVAVWDYPWRNLRRRLSLAAATTALAEKARGAAASDFQPFAWVPRLWKARMLHFRGMVETEREARKKGVLHDPINDHAAAAQLYLHPRVRPSDKTLQTAVPNAERLAIYRRTKADATYWLALLKYDQGKPRQSKYWLEEKTLSRLDAGHRKIGVRYNLARVLEAQQQNQAAAELLNGSESPQSHGDRVRAASLSNEDKPSLASKPDA